MSFTDIKTKNQGFTIVELLIVVVVIAILAAITIVSYNGITNRANASSAKSTAATWQKKIELYQAEKGGYPFAFSSLNTAPTTSSDAWYVAPTTPLSATLTADNGKNTVTVVPCGASAAATSTTTTGIRITYYIYDGAAANSNILNLGNTGNCTATAWANP